MRKLAMAGLLLVALLAAPALGRKQRHSKTCNFRKIQRGNTDEWASALASTQEPVILKGFDWDRLSGCSSLNACVERHGDLMVGVATGAQMAVHGAEEALNSTWIADSQAPFGVRRASNSADEATTPWTMPIRDLAAAMRNSTLPTDAYAFYEMRGTALAADFQHLRMMFALVLSHQHPQLAGSSSLEEAKFFSVRLALGGRLSGTGWHRHGPALLGLTEGTKSWFAARMDTLPGSVYDSIAKYNTAPTHEWLAGVTKAGGMWQTHLYYCTQEAGDVVFVPDQMSHAIINQGETLAIGVQLAQNAEIRT